MTPSTERWIALILAGQRPGPDPLAAHFFGRLKALVLVGGEPMVTRVVRTVRSMAGIRKTVVLAQDIELVEDAVADGGGADFFRSGAGISTSILAFADATADAWPLFVTTADHPLLTQEMIAFFLAQAEGCDVAIGMVERAVMQAAYPDNKRTWLKFRDGHWSGTNLFALRTDKARAALALWAEAEQDRKKAWKLFLHFGPWLALRALTRTIGLEDGLHLAGRRLGLTAKLVPMPFAEAAIDVDKLSDHVQAEAILKAQSAHGIIAGRAYASRKARPVLPSASRSVGGSANRAAHQSAPIRTATIATSPMGMRSAGGSTFMPTNRSTPTPTIRAPTATSRARKATAPAGAAKG